MLLPNFTLKAGLVLGLLTRAAASAMGEDTTLNFMLPLAPPEFTYPMEGEWLRRGAWRNAMHTASNAATKPYLQLASHPFARC